MRSTVHSIFTISLTIMVSFLIACTSLEEPPTSPLPRVVAAVDTPVVDCKILASTDPNLADSRTITHLNFQCNRQAIAPPYRFTENNPYFSIQLPLRDRTNSPQTLPENYLEWLEGGHINFYLNELDYKIIHQALPNGLPARFRDYRFSTAGSICNHKIFKDTFAIVTYYFTLHGSESEAKPPHQIHLEGMLQVINHLGEVIYEYQSSDYAFTDPYLDTDRGLLTFKRSGYQDGYLLNGYEVHQLGSDTILHQLDFAPKYIAGRSMHTVENPTIIPLKDRTPGYLLQKLLLFDPEVNGFFEKTFPPNYDYDFVWADSNFVVLHKSIYRDGIQGQHEFFDTVNINEFTPYRN